MGDGSSLRAKDPVNMNQVKRKAYSNVLEILKNFLEKKRSSTRTVASGLFV